MTGHLTDQELEGFRNRTSAPQQLLRADRHLATCPECQRRLRSVESTSALPLPGLALENEPIHATYQQICAFIDGGQEAPEREWMEYHLQACAQCSAEVRDLQQFDARMLAEVQVPALARKPTESGWKTWLATLFAAPRRPAFIAASLSLIVIGLLSMTHLQVGTPGAADTHTSIYQVTHFDPGDTKRFYGGLLLAALGLAGVWYRFRK